ncbi:MAG: phosphotransferase enzyme family protein [Candidatus Puniceispirillaceae bacterium]
MTDSDATRLPALASLAAGALSLWDVPTDARPRLINLSENATYLVEAAGFRSILRIHREGYHTRRAIECELAWMAALSRDGGVQTARPVAGRDGLVIQRCGSADLAPRHMVMFEFLEGDEPDPDQDLVAAFHQLGRLAARAHLHVISWSLPQPFERLVWDDEAVFGPAPTWGDWRDAPGVDDRIAAILSSAELLLRRRLAAYGRGAERYGLIHADMRLANLLIDGGKTRLIDFDDCGFGWFMYDFAAGISFMEDHPQVPALRAAWLAGYREVRRLAVEDEIEIDSFVMLRRLALLAWIGSHGDTELAIAQAPHFADVSARLATEYLNRFGA